MKQRATLCSSTFLAFCLTLLLAVPAARGQDALVLTVNSPRDNITADDMTPGDDVCDTGEAAPNTNGEQDECTLRAAIDEANANPGERVVINVPGQLPGGTSGNYTLGRMSNTNELYDDANDFGDLDITGRTAMLTIRGTGTPGPTVSISPNDRVFDFQEGAMAVLEHMDVTGGTARAGDNGSARDGTRDGEDGDSGGALRNAGTLEIDQVAFFGNQTTSGGNAQAGGEGEDGGNGGAGGDGGAIFNTSTATLTVMRSTFSGNNAGDGGSGASGGGPATSGGIAGAGGDGGDGGSGGAIYNEGTLTVEETTVVSNLGGSGNSGGDGGSNAVPDGQTGAGGNGGGISTVNGGTLDIKNTIVAQNTAGDDNASNSNPKRPGSDLFDATGDGQPDLDLRIVPGPGTITTQGANLIGTNNSVEDTFPSNGENENENGDYAGTGQQQSMDRINPQVGSLNRNDDEYTSTRPLLMGSLAIDNGENTDIAGNEIEVDQRGFLRPGTRSGDTQVDIGAYEFMSEPTPDMLVINEIDPVNTGNDMEFVELTNTGEYPLQLSDFALVFYDGTGNRTGGTEDLAYYQQNLEGELDPGMSYYVIGDAARNPDLPFYGDDDLPAGSGNVGDNMVDESGAVALYRGKATDYPDGAAAGQNADTRQDVIVYEGPSGSGTMSSGAVPMYASGASLVASAAFDRMTGARRPAMDASSLCGAFGSGCSSPATDSGDGESIQRNPDGSTSSGEPSPGEENTTSTQRQTFTVNSTGDAPDADPSDGVCDTGNLTGGVAECTLRAALQTANNVSGADNIDFSVSGTIAVGGSADASGQALPTVTDPVNIDTGMQDITVDGDACTEDNNPVPDANTDDPAPGDACIGLYFAEGSSNSTLRDLTTQNFSGNGVLITSSSNTFDGLTATMNDRAGLRLRTLDGSTAAADDNTVENGTFTANRDGVRISNGASANVVRNSTLSNNVLRPGDTDNGGRGIQIKSGASDNTVLENTIAGNATEGIEVRETPGNGDTDGNTLSQNSISNNGGVNIPGVNLTESSSNDASPNDADDDDTGANRGQNFPVISETSYDESANEAMVTYSVPSAEGNSAYPLTVEFFRVGPENEGMEYLGMDEYTTPQGEETATFTTPEAIEASDQIVATATDADGNTSEFSGEPQALPVELAGGLEVSPAGSDGHMLLTWQTLTEEGSRGFYIDRRQSETDDWTRVDFVPSKAENGTSQEAIRYTFTDKKVPYEAKTLTYRLRQEDSRDGTKKKLAERTVEVAAPQTFTLHGNFPNPVRTQTTIRYELPEMRRVTIEVYDVLGRKVKTLVDEEQAGKQKAILRAGSLASGTYFYRITAGDYTETRKLVLVR